MNVSTIESLVVDTQRKNVTNLTLFSRELSRPRMFHLQYLHAVLDLFDKIILDSAYFVAVFFTLLTFVAFIGI